MTAYQRQQDDESPKEDTVAFMSQANKKKGKLKIDESEFNAETINKKINKGKNDLLKGLDSKDDNDDNEDMF